MPPQRRTDGAHTRPSCALLLPQLFARATHQLAILGGVGTGALAGAVMLHRFPKQFLVDRAENFLGQRQGAYFLAAQIYYINLRHSFFRKLGSLTTKHSPTDYSFFLGCLALRSLQRIDRACATESTALSRRLLGFGYHYIAFSWPRHRAFHHQQVFVFVNTQHPQVASGDTVHAHVSRHAHAFEHAGREGRRADRASDLEHGAVRGSATGKLVAFHHARESAAFAGCNYIHKLLTFEDVHQHLVAGFGPVLVFAVNHDRNLAQKAHRR